MNYTPFITALCCALPAMVQAAEPSFHQQNCNKLAQIQKDLQRCVAMSVEKHDFRDNSSKETKLNDEECKELLSILSHAKALKVKGKLMARMAGCTKLVMYDAKGKALESITTWALIPESKAKPPYHYLSLARMSLPDADYKPLRELINKD